jgi:hypothetical protein
MLTQAEVAQELVWAGLGDWNKPTAEIKEFEAYGDGKLSMVIVHADGKAFMLTGDNKPKTLWEGYVEDAEQLVGLVERFGHYAPC